MDPRGHTPERCAVFLDRDGVLNRDTGYVHRHADWAWLPGARAAVARLNRAGFAVIVASNQSGIARGLFDRATVDRLHAAVDRDLAAAGARIDGYYICPHHPDHGAGRCACRKPAPGLLLRAAADHGLDLGRCHLVGDRARDLAAARAAGVAPILVAGPDGAGPECAGADPAPRVASLAAAVDLILAATAESRP
jgi:D-glycero-D-manno-heptose 1,7-bisphosphate phosphatase